MDTARGASGRRAPPWPTCRFGSSANPVRRFLAASAPQRRRRRARPAPAPGRAVIDPLAGAGVAGRPYRLRGCVAARDIGLYRSHGYRVAEIRVFDAFPLTHHVECFACSTARRADGLGVPGSLVGSDRSDPWR